MDIRYGNIRLAALAEEDAGLLFEMVNDPETESGIVGWSLPVSWERHLEWMHKPDSLEAGRIRFAVKNAEGATAGMISLTEIDLKSRSAAVNIKIAQRYRNQGLGKQAIAALTAYAFGQLNLHRLEMDILESNIASQKTLENIGFTLEGTRREKIYKNGAYRNLREYGLLKRDANRKTGEGPEP